MDTAWADETIPVLTIQKNINAEIEVVSNVETELVSIEKKNAEITINGKKTSMLYIATINSGTKFVLKNTIANLRKTIGYWNAENSQTINPFRKGTEYAYDSDLCKSLKTSEAILKKLNLNNMYATNCGAYYFVGISNAEKTASVLIQIKETAVPIDKSKLKTAIESADAIVAKSAGYYTEDDRYNGKSSSADGFWNDLKSALSAAKNIYSSADSSQDQINRANDTLTAAIANLIPTSQLNATKLYEALRPLYWAGSTDQLAYEGIASWQVSADNCTQASWTAYMQTREPAEAYLAKLFDKDGNATAFNKAEAAKGDQPGETEADKLAKAVDSTQLVKLETYNDVYKTWKSHEAEAASLLVQYDPAKLKEANYTEASWKTYTDTYHALKEIVEYRIIGGTRADYDMLHSLYQNGDWLTNLLPESYNKLESKGDITVTLQYTNGLAAAYPAVRTSGTDAYCGEVSLTDGNTTVKDAFDKAGIILDTGKK